MPWGALSTPHGANHFLAMNQRDGVSVRFAKASQRARGC